jgi:hypothetical protein
MDIFPFYSFSLERTLEMRRKLQFNFCFPPIYGIYDTGKGEIYVFGEHDGNFVDVLSHEVLHWTVQKVAGKRASLSLDNVPSRALRA